MLDVRSAVRLATPSLLTLGALVFGLSAVRLAAEEDFRSSVTCVLLAAIFDGLDGHVARYLEACTKFGFELDSLCDCANFGVVPTFVVYFWAKSLPAVDCRSEQCRFEHALLWFSCCCYSSCCALRLARFNVDGHAAQMDKAYLQPSEGDRPPVPKAMLHNFLQRKMYFKGIPAPVGAAYALTPMMLHLSETSRIVGAVGDVGAWAIGRRGTAVTLCVTGVLMVCTLPTLSSKMFKMGPSDSHLRSRGPASRVAKGCAFAAFCYLFKRFPFDIILALNLMHLLSIPLGVLIFCKFADGKRD